MGPSDLAPRPPYHNPRAHACTPRGGHRLHHLRRPPNPISAIVASRAEPKQFKTSLAFYRALLTSGQSGKSCALSHPIIAPKITLGSLLFSDADVRRHRPVVDNFFRTRQNPCHIWRSADLSQNC